MPPFGLRAEIAIAGTNQSARTSRFATRKNESSSACAHDGVGGSGDHCASEQSVG
jgi:hypothetical protein